MTRSRLWLLMQCLSPVQPGLGQRRHSCCAVLFANTSPFLPALQSPNMPPHCVCWNFLQIEGFSFVSAGTLPSLRACLPCDVVRCLLPPPVVSRTNYMCPKQPFLSAACTAPHCRFTVELFVLVSIASTSSSPCDSEWLPRKLSSLVLNFCQRSLTPHPNTAALNIMLC